MSYIDARQGGTVNNIQRDQINTHTHIYHYGSPVSEVADELIRRLRSPDTQPLSKFQWQDNSSFASQPYVSSNQSIQIQTTPLSRSQQCQ
jgi:hypothetical protein